jgi:hypothetical protein
LNFLPAIAEVISSSVTDVVAQSLVTMDEGGLPKATKPRFGSFVRIGSENGQGNIFAVVNNVVTGPADGVHRLSAFGLSREQLRLQQPQIFALLRTDINALVVGYSQGKKTYSHLPPQPPEVHDFMYNATVEDISRVTESFDFLRLLMNVPNVPADELLAASVREAYLAQDKNEKFLMRAGQALSQLFRSDYDRLLSILHKIKPD